MTAYVKENGFLGIISYDEFEDSAGYMTKQKLYYYNFWKNMRGVLYEVKKKGYLANASILTTPMANEFYGWLRRLYDAGKAGQLPANICADAVWRLAIHAARLLLIFFTLFLDSKYFCFKTHMINYSYPGNAAKKISRRFPLVR